MHSLVQLTGNQELIGYQGLHLQLNQASVEVLESIPSASDQ